MSLLGHDKRTVKSWKAAPEEMSLEATVKDGQWRCWRDVLRNTDPDTRVYHAICLFTPPAFAGYSFQPAQREGSGLGAWLSAPRWFTRPKTVTLPGTNRAKRRVTMLIESNTKPATIHRVLAASDWFSQAAVFTYFHSVHVCIATNQYTYEHLMVDYVTFKGIKSH